MQGCCEKEESSPMEAKRPTMSFSPWEPGQLDYPFQKDFCLIPRLISTAGDYPEQCTTPSNVPGKLTREPGEESLLQASLETLVSRSAPPASWGHSFGFLFEQGWRAQEAGPARGGLTPLPCLFYNEDIHLALLGREGGSFIRIKKFPCAAFIKRKEEREKCFRTRDREGEGRYALNIWNERTSRVWRGRREILPSGWGFRRLPGVAGWAPGSSSQPLRREPPPAGPHTRALGC